MKSAIEVLVQNMAAVDQTLSRKTRGRGHADRVVELLGTEDMMRTHHSSEEPIQPCNHPGTQLCTAVEVNAPVRSIVGMSWWEWNLLNLEAVHVQGAVKPHHRYTPKAVPCSRKIFFLSSDLS